MSDKCNTCENWDTSFKAEPCLLCTENERAPEGEGSNQYQEKVREAYVLMITGERVGVFSSKEKAEEHGMKMKPCEIIIIRHELDNVAPEGSEVVQHMYID